MLTRFLFHITLYNKVAFICKVYGGIMTIKKHLLLFAVAFIGWLVFFVLGYKSNYYTDWSIESLMLFCFIIVFGMIPVISTVLIILLGENYIRNSIWVAFYGSVVLFIFDFLVVGIIQGYGISFLTSHWLLSFGYLIFWISPFFGYVLKRFKESLQTI